ncbi:hypothetical protein ES702_05510 [subsurface metagenome]
MRSRAAIRDAEDRDEFVDKMFLEILDLEEQRRSQEQQPIQTWNPSDAEDEEKALAAAFAKGSNADILDALNDELEVETYEFMKDDTEWDSDDEMNDG